ncbi:hypothetical protein P3T26_000227 [Streptomyces sp. MAA16]|nr:hypothetical protein [Streptomyces sp. MAA16]
MACGEPMTRAVARGPEGGRRPRGPGTRTSQAPRGTGRRVATRRRLGGVREVEDAGHRQGPGGEGRPLGPGTRTSQVPHGTGRRRAAARRCAGSRGRGPSAGFGGRAAATRSWHPDVAGTARDRTPPGGGSAACGESRTWAIARARRGGAATRPRHPDVTGTARDRTPPGGCSTACGESRTRAIARARRAGGGHAVLAPGRHRHRTGPDAGWRSGRRPPATPRAGRDAARPSSSGHRTPAPIKSPAAPPGRWRRPGSARRPPRAGPG